MDQQVLLTSRAKPVFPLQRYLLIFVRENWKFQKIRKSSFIVKDAAHPSVLANIVHDAPNPLISKAAMLVTFLKITKLNFVSKKKITNFFLPVCRHSTIRTLVSFCDYGMPAFLQSISLLRSMTISFYSFWYI